MYSGLIDKYYNVIDYLFKVSQQKNEIGEFSKTSLINFLNGLYGIEKNNRELYEKLFDDLKLDKEKLIKINNEDNEINKDNEKKKELDTEKEFNEKNDEVSENNIIEENKNEENIFSKYDKELENIFKNPNEESLKVWLKNIVSSAKEKNVSDDKITEFIYDEFDKYDKNNNYNVDKLLNEVRENKNTTESITLDKKEVEKKDANNIEDELDVYVLENIVRSDNKKMVTDFHYLLKDTKENIEDNNMKLFKDDVEGMNEYISLYNLDKDKMFDYFKIYVKKTNKEMKREKKLLDIIEDVRNNKKENLEEEKEDIVKPLKIVGMKKTFNSKLKNKVLLLTALSGLGITIANPLLGIGLGIGACYLYKLTGNKKLIEKNGFAINENDEIVDKTGKVITKEDIGKLNYNIIKRELMKTNDKGTIKKEYKKNRLTSLLLNNSLVDSIKQKFQKKESNEYESTQLVKDINSGMRQVR